MKKMSSYLVGSLSLSFFFMLTPLHAKAMTQKEIIAEAEKTALNEFNRLKWDFRHRGWVNGTFWAGVSDLSKVSDNPKVAAALKKFSESRGVRIGVGVLERHDKKDPLNADDFCVGQTFLDYYVKTKNPKVLADTKRRVNKVSEYILSDEAAKKAASFSELGTHEGLTWSWIDAIFMAAPLHARLTKVTGDPKYLNSMMLEWKRVSNRLYDKDEHLYYRDKSFLTIKSKNGKKVFWSRGNGWVMGAFAHTLPYIPKDNPQRPWLVKQFKEMSTKLASIQQPDGTWSPSLIDYKHFPYSEMSGTAFNCFAIAWGINNKILDEKTFLAVVEKAWAALLAARNEKGFLGYIQGVGAKPAPVKVKRYTLYGNGAFLMAAVEMSKLAPVKRLPPPTLSAIPPKNLTSILRPVHAPEPTTFCLFVPERSDDFAWENDLIAFRVYGPALKKGNENSGIDCWLKRVKYPILKKWYTKNEKGHFTYHKDHGEGSDFYHVGKSRGCGGTAIWHKGKMILSNVYKKWKIIQSKPVKSIFELTYDYEFDGRKIHEVKTITIELGKRLFKSESVFTENGKTADLEIAIGLTTHDQRGVVTFEPDAGWMSVWEDHHGKNGKLGTGVVMKPSRITGMREIKSKQHDESHAILTCHTDKKGKTVHYAGYGWNQVKGITTQKQWNAYLEKFAASL